MVPLAQPLPLAFHEPIARAGEHMVPVQSAPPTAPGANAASHPACNAESSSTIPPVPVPAWPDGSGCNGVAAGDPANPVGERRQLSRDGVGILDWTRTVAAGSVTVMGFGLNGAWGAGVRWSAGTSRPSSC